MIREVLLFYLKNQNLENKAKTKTKKEQDLILIEIYFF
jgi:hypothetical protein